MSAEVVLSRGKENLVWVSQLIIDRHPENHQQHLQLVWCPACGCRIWQPSDGAARKTRDHIAQHDPEDFGLSPIGERRSQR